MRYFFLSFFFLIVFEIRSQNTAGNNGVSLIPPAPSAAALAKFIDIPVSHYTGTAEISIPLLSIKEKELSVDVGLNYHASGLKVDEVAGWVGTNWALNYGGAISRSVVGLADEADYGFLYHYNTIQTIANTYNPDLNVHFSTLREFAEGRWDSQPDVFFLSLPGYSVKFYLTPNGVVTVPYTKISIQPTFSNVSNISGFIVKTPDGNTYNFNQSERSQAVSAYGENPSPYNSSWYLGNITSKNGNTITFEYSDQNVGYLSARTVSRRDKIGEAIWTPYNQFVCPPWDETEGFIGVYLSNAKKIKKIITSNGYIEFFLSNTREDTGNIYYHRNMTFSESKLDRIELHNSSGGLVRGFNLTYGYFNCVGTPWSTKRLKLQSVTEFGSNGNSLPAHQFEYEENWVPSVQSNAQDHWGFHNSKGGNYFYPQMNYNGVDFPGADRSTDQDDLSRLKGGILTKITYPTGGTTSFDYEVHGSIVKIGGLRIKQITHRDPIAEKSFNKKYVYNPPLLMNNPRYDYVTDDITWVNEALNGWETGLSPKKCSYLVRSAKSQNATGSGSHVIYDNITEFNESEAFNGKTIFQYFLPGRPPGQGAFPFPPASTVASPEGWLKETIHYTSSNNPVRKETNSANDSGQNLTPTNPNNSTVIKAFAIGNNYRLSGLYPVNVNLNVTYLNYFQIAPYLIDSRWIYLTKKEVYHYDQNDANKSVKAEEEYFYENASHAQITKKTTKDSKDRTIETTYKYPNDFSASGNVYEKMVNAYIINPVIEEVSKIGEQQLNKRNIWFYNPSGNLYVPQKIETQIGNGALVTDAEFLSYDGSGNVLRYKGKDGITEKLEYYYSGGKNNLVSQRIQEEGSSASQTTSYDYKPLVGLSRSTDPSGKQTHYIYDNFNRLSEIREDNSGGNLLQSFHYNYANAGFAGPGISGNPDVSAPSNPGLITGGGGCTPPPTLSINANGNEVCSTQSVTFNLNSGSSCTNGTVRWLNNGSEAGTGTSFTTFTPGNYTATCTIGSCTSTPQSPISLAQKSGCVTNPGCSNPRNPENPSSTSPGVTYKYYEGSTGLNWCATSTLAGIGVKKTGNVSNFLMTQRDRNEYMGFEFAGYLEVPTEGQYTFYFLSDDAGAFYIGNQAVVTYEGCHGMDSEQSGTICLKAGKHAIKALVAQGAGGYGISVKWSGPGISKQDIPDARLSYSGSGCTAPSAPAISQTSGSTVCPATNQQVTLTATGSGITWYRDGTQVGTGTTYTTSQTGSYTAKASSGTCISNASNTITVTQSSGCGGGGTSVTCNGYTFTEGQVIGTTTQGENFVVHFNGNCPSAVSGTNGNAVHFNALTYLLNKTIPDAVLLSCLQWFQYDQPAICSSSCTTPAAPTVSPASGTVCAASNQTLTLTATGSGITWYRDGTQVGTGTTYTTSQAGSYTAKASSGTCISNASNTVTVTQSSGCGGGTSVSCNGYTFTEGQVIGTTTQGENFVVHFNGNCPSAVSGTNGNAVHFNALTYLLNKTIPDAVLLSCLQWFQYDQPAICSSSCTTPADPTVNPTSGTVCAASNQTLTLTTAGSGIIWYRDGTQVGTGVSFTASQAGSYTAKASSGTCISNASNTVVVQQAANCGSAGDCYGLRIVPSQKYVTTKNGPVEVVPTTIGNKEIWQLQDAGGGYYKIVSKASTSNGLVLGVAGQGNTGGNVIELQSSTSGGHQLWKKMEVDSATPPRYVFERQNSTLILSVIAYGNGTDDGQPDITLASDDLRVFGGNKFELVSTGGCPN